MTKKTNTNKHMPLRTCVACRQVKNKWDMVRLVSSDNGIITDSNSRGPGRGAYLCRRQECWQKGLSGNQLEYALKTKISGQNREQLAEYGSSLNG